MLKKRYLAAVVAAAGLWSCQSAIAAEECGDLTIGSMNWASADFITELDKLILTEGYGCGVEIVAGDTMPTFTSMNEKGKPDMASEFWINAVRAPLDAAVERGELIITAEVLRDGASEGWWIPKYVADAHPEIKTPADALARPDLFPAPEDPSKGGVYNCPAGWNCQISTGNLFTAYGAEEKGFELVDTGSAAGLDGSIAKAYERKEGWLGYYWAPNSILDRYELVLLDMGSHDKEEWDSCTAVLDCEGPKVNGWPISEVYTVVTKDFAAKASVAMDYVSTRSIGNNTLNKMLAWMTENQATGEEAALYFLEAFEDEWAAWVTPEAKAKVKASL